LTRIPLPSFAPYLHMPASESSASESSSSRSSHNFANGNPTEPEEGGTEPLLLTLWTQSRLLLSDC